MATKIFVNLPVKDLNRFMEFFSQLGYTFNPNFTNEAAACMIISEDIYTMLVTEPYYKTFITKEVSDASKTSECIVCLSADSRQDVDNVIGKAVKAGATTPKDPQDHGFMYSHGFQDLDGHLWEYAYMDMSAIPQQ